MKTIKRIINNVIIASVLLTVLLLMYALTILLPLLLAFNTDDGRWLILLLFTTPLMFSCVTELFDLVDVLTNWLEGDINEDE